MSLHHISAFVLSAFLLACQPPTTDVAQKLAEPQLPHDQDNEIVIGSIDTIESVILDEDRDLWIYLPRSAQDENSDQLYPVVYLLDGNGHFRSVSGMIYQLSTVNGNKTLPEMIVVGIPNTDRMRDLTPTHTEGTTGGGTAFLDFIESEVIPHVEANYPASQYRTFIGHSLGGLMAIEALITTPEVFENYIAIDPSLWWDEQSVLHRAESALRERDFTGKSLFVSVANTLPFGMKVDEVVSDSEDRTTHIRSILQFSRSADSDNQSGLNFGWSYYDNDTHGSVPLISEYDGLRFLFPWYDPNFKLRQFTDPERADNPDEIGGFIAGHFQTISDRFGFSHKPPVRWMNSIVSGLLFNDKPSSAFAVAQLNLANFPENPITHEAMGNYFLQAEDMDSARIHFQHALDRGAEFDLEEKLTPPDESQ